MFDRNTIFHQLEEMGTPRTGVVLVHASLRSVGEVEGRGDGFINILKEYFTAEGGLLCIPTHTWANTLHSDRITLDLAEGGTCIGMLATLASRRPDAVRTAHPTHSMAVFGDREAVLHFIEGEDKRITPAAPDGCYGKLADMNGKVLLIGVGHERNTYMHAVEEMMHVSNRLSAEPVCTTVRHPNGEIEKRYVHYHAAAGIPHISEQYPKYDVAFRRFGHISDGFVGNAPALLCDARGMRDVMMLVRQRSEGRELCADHVPLDPAWYE
ncbi:MAG: AAC(3) family N-acetyltransferase [Clostridia bacterium]|nr:AAC(3) family N-acetyltransferase [Clostridia bacterium]